MSPVVPNDKDAEFTLNDTKEKMVGEAVKVDPAQTPLTDGKRFGPLGGLQHESPQLCIEFVSKFVAGDPFVILHDRINIGTNLRMKDEAHQRRRARIWWSS